MTRQVLTLAERHEDWLYPNLSIRQLNELAVRHLTRPNDQLPELDLFTTKWHDHKLLHPVRATALFAQCYREVYREFSVFRGGNEAAHRAGLPVRSLFELSSANFLGLWRARQQADSLGIPYDFYCRSFFTYANWGWEHLPRPGHMVESMSKDEEKREKTRKALAFVKDRWIEHARTTLILAEEPFFTVEQFIDHPYQEAYQSMLLERVARHPAPDTLLCTLIFIKGQLMSDRAETRFGTSLVKRARDLHQSLN